MYSYLVHVQGTMYSYVRCAIAVHRRATIVLLLVHLHTRVRCTSYKVPSTMYKRYSYDVHMYKLRRSRAIVLYLVLVPCTRYIVLPVCTYIVQVALPITRPCTCRLALVCILQVSTLSLVLLLHVYLAVYSQKLEPRPMRRAPVVHTLPPSSSWISNSRAPSSRPPRDRIFTVSPVTV